MDVLKIENLSFKYNKNNILNSISLSLRKGEFIGLAGRNGSGKSTLGKVIAGLETEIKGGIFYLDKEYRVKEIGNIRERISLVFQNPNNQIIGNTVLDDLAFALENRGIPRKEIKERVDWIARQFNITSLLSKNPNELSGGQKQIVAIAGVLIFSPDIIILDEVTSMLDLDSKRAVRGVLEQIRGEHTILFISHDAEDLMLTDRIIILEDGEIAGQYLTKEFFENTEVVENFKIERPIRYEVESKLIEDGFPKESVREWIDKLK